MITLNNKAVLSHPDLINKIHINDRAEGSECHVFMNEADAPAAETLAFLVIKNAGEETFPIMLKRWVRVQDVLRIHINSDPNNTLCKVVFYEHKESFRYARMLNNVNVVHVGEEVVARFLGSTPRLINEVSFWSDIEDYMDVNNIRLDVSGLDEPPVVAKQLFWNGMDKLSCLKQLAESYCIRYLEEVAEEPTYDAGTGDIIYPTTFPWSLLVFKKRESPLLPTGINYEDIAYTDNFIQLTNSVAFRTLQSYANNYDADFYYSSSNPLENDVLLFPHYPVNVDEAIPGELGELETYLGETNINHHYELFFTTTYLDENQLYNPGLQWSDVEYIENDGDFTINVYHRPFTNVVHNPVGYHVDVEFVSGISRNGGSASPVDNMQDLTSGWLYEDGYELTISSRELPRAGDRVWGYRAGTNFYGFGLDPVKPAPPVLASEVLSSIDVDYSSLPGQTTQYTLPIDSTENFWRYNITSNVVTDPAFTLNIDNRGVATPSSGFPGGEVFWSLDRSEADILAHLQLPKYVTSTYSLAQQEALAEQLWHNYRHVRFHVYFPVSTKRVGFYIIPGQHLFKELQTKIEVPAQMSAIETGVVGTIEAIDVPSSTGATATRNNIGEPAEDVRVVEFTDFVLETAPLTDTGIPFVGFDGTANPNGQNSRISTYEYTVILANEWRKIMLENAKCTVTYNTVPIPWSA